MIIIVSALAFVTIFWVTLWISSLSQKSYLSRVRARLDQEPDSVDTSIFRNERMSSIGFLNRILNQLRIARRLEQLLVQAGLSLKVSVFMLMSLSLGGAVGFIAQLLLRHPTLALSLGVVAGLIPLLAVIAKKNRRIKLFNEQFPDAIDMMVNALRAGFALNGAIQMVAEESPEPTAGEFRIMFEEQKLGLDIRKALLNFSERMASTDAAIFVTAVLIQRQTGGNLAEVLQKLATVIRDRFRILGEVRTLTSQGRLSGFILALLPVFMAIAISLISPGYMGHLLNDNFGSILITVAVGLQVMGFLIIRRIVNIKV
jgi:tight adherence protein B